MPSGGPDRKRSDLLFNVIAAVIAAAIFVALYLLEDRLFGFLEHYKGAR